MAPISTIWTRWATDPRWVVLAAALLFGCNLWGWDLWAPDEPFFAEGAREMIVDGEWLVPHINGEVNTHKPPLFFWLIALTSLPFGSVSSLTARLPSVLAALGSVMLTMRLARRTSGNRTALLAGAMLATTYIFWDKARSAQIDATLCFLILVALSAFEAFRAGDWSGRRAGVVFWAACALAVLAKGPVGVLLPLGIAVATLAFDRDLRRWRSFAPLLGPLAFATILGAWVAATVVWADDYSVLGALREHFVDRAIHGMHHKQPVWYYLKVTPYAFFPWSFLLPGALVLAWRRRWHADDRFLLVASLAVVVFFTVSTEKRDLYILPAVPFFALLIARLVAAIAGWWPAATAAAKAPIEAPREEPGELTTKVPGRKWVTVPQGLVGGLMVLAGIALPLVAPRFGQEMFGPAVALAAVLAVGGVGSLIMGLRGQVLATVSWSGATIALAMLVAVTCVMPLLEPIKSGRELAVVVREQTAHARAAGRPVLAWELYNVERGVNFYSNGVYLKGVATPEQLLSELATGDTVYLLADEDTLPVLPGPLRERMTVVYSTRLSRKDLVLLRFGG